MGTWGGHQGHGGGTVWHAPSCARPQPSVSPKPPCPDPSAAAGPAAFQPSLLISRRVPATISTCSLINFPLLLLRPKLSRPWRRSACARRVVLLFMAFPCPCHGSWGRGCCLLLGPHPALGAGHVPKEGQQQRPPLAPSPLAAWPCSKGRREVAKGMGTLWGTPAWLCHQPEPGHTAHSPCPLWWPPPCCSTGLHKTPSFYL